MDACPACGSGPVAWVAEAAADVCTRCGAVITDGPDALDALESYSELEAREPRVPDDLYRLGRASLKRQGAVRVAALIDAAARRLGVEAGRAPVLYTQLDELLGHSRAEPLAAATLYVSLRLDERLVDLPAVALACDVPFAAAARAVVAVCRLHVLPRVCPVDPGVYVEAQTACIAELAHGPKLDYAAAARLARGVARMANAFDIPYTMDAVAFAYAIVMHALQGAAGKALAADTLLFPEALEARPSTGCVAAPLLGTPSHSTILTRYAEVSKMLAHATEALPWFASRPVLRRERDRKRRKGDTRRTASHNDIALYLADVVEVSLHTPPPQGDSWSRFQTVRTRTHQPSARPSLAARLHLSGVDIDALSDQDVDALFAHGELDSYMRTPEESEFLRTIKGWDDVRETQQAPVEAPPGPPPPL
ncbi:hypothetical protein MCUN1_001152 [Malassezia cuniculi]|uniref:Transcription initiation factor IIB n=1 Tax=Malassezia cuniculi TaxID=948313 RepID=A0AAF0EX70_9BASI|nr:hypothetical protein MCUN1_001152 [Malassezia cuniculi]